MIKSALAAVVAAPLFAGAAVAGPYVNVEANSASLGSDYIGTETDLHVGYEGDLGESASWYIQAGPAFVACLLYTSPSPRDQRGSRMPSSA